MHWDAIVQGRRDPRRGGQQPLEPGASLTMPLPHRVGGPLPDNVQVVAGVWNDGTTFGEADRLKVILNNRTSAAGNYEQAIAFLKTAVDQNWTLDQYLSALNGKPNSLPFYAIRSTLEANRNASDSSGKAIQSLLGYFTQKLALLRQAKPAADTTAGKA